LLIDAAAEISGQRILCTSPGLAQFAGHIAQSLPDVTVSCIYLDLYRAGLASDYWRDSRPHLQVTCDADLPEGQVDAVAFPFSANGEAELTRDLIQAGHQRLRLGGKMYAATDNRHDTWLGEQLRTVFKKLERRERETGALYVGTNTEPRKKLKSFSCEFAFRDRGRLIRAYSRPGVFSHRHIDPGARHLINAMAITPGAHVLDIGCGAGTVALAAACRADNVQVHAIDSNARAVECTALGATLNGLANISTELNADGNCTGLESYDLAVANPPYYAGFRIAEHFLHTGRKALRPGGMMLVVGKHPQWYEENMPLQFDHVERTECKGYFLFQGVRPRV